MKADTKDLLQVFANNVQYEVPLFQRPYVWSEDDHWSPLWEDVVALLDGHGPGENRPHFLGAVVLEQKHHATGAVERRLIIDGQQRMTTLQLLLGAVRKVTSDLGLGDLAAQLNQMVENAPFVLSAKSERFKVLPTQADQAGFASALDGAASGESSLERAYGFFENSVRSWLDDQDDQVQATTELVRALQRRLMLVVIDLDDSDESQVIFETLNARGTPLEATDLIKNSLFQAARAEGADEQQLHDEYWIRFLDDYWREEVRQGRLIRSRIDVFATHYLTMRVGREVRSSQLFKDFKVWMDSSRLGAAEVMADLDLYGEAFTKFDNGLETDRERRFFDNLRTMDTSTVYPFLLWLYGESRANAGERLAILDSIESFLVRRILLRLTAKNYNRFFLSMLTRARSADNVPEAVERFLLESDADANRWPRDTELVRRLPELKMYGYLRRDRIQMVLDGVNRLGLGTSPHQEPIQIAGDLTIEHLMPQNWEANWPIGPGVEARDHRADLIQTIGNLTLLTQSLNTSISNGPWSRKREEILRHSALPINRVLPDEWGEEAIEDRSKQIAAAIAKVWPCREQSQSAPVTASPEAPVDSQLDEVAVGPVSTDSEPQTARSAILKAFSSLQQRTGKGLFGLSELLAEIRGITSRYPEGTLRAHIVAHMCVNCGAPTQWPDLVRVDRGMYRLAQPEDMAMSEPSRGLGEALPPEVTAAEVDRTGSTTWTHDRFFEVLEASRTSDDVRAARRLVDWCAAKKLRMDYGRGKDVGSISPKYLSGPVAHNLFTLWTDGGLAIQFGSMKPPFGEADRKIDLIERINDVPGFDLTEEVVTKWPLRRLSLLSDSGAFERFTAVFEWMFSVIDWELRVGKDGTQ